MASDGRDWHSYNEALVRRRELNLDSSITEEWKRELKKENEGKVGGTTLIPFIWGRSVRKSRGADALTHASPTRMDRLCPHSFHYHMLVFMM
jgi:hypothetical protein